MSGDIAGGQNRQSRRSRPAAKLAKPKDGREKIALLLSKETNVKLSTLAALKRRGQQHPGGVDLDRDSTRRRDLAYRRAGGWGRGGR